MKKKKWYKIGVFSSEDSAKKLCPHFFSDAKFEAYFTVEGNLNALWINQDYWFSFTPKKEVK